VSIKSAFQGFRARVPVAVILTWAWVVLTTTIAVYVFGESPFAGTLTFLSALAVFPPLYALLELRYKRPVPTPLRTAPAAIFFAIGMSSLMSADFRPNDTEPKPAGVHILLDLVGVGDDDTDSFTSRPQNWRLEYVFQCWQFGRPGNFRIDIQRPDGSPSGLQGVQVHAKASAYSYLYTPGGTFRLHIVSNCHWRVKANG
jgi:hypothetical protein